MKVNFKKLTFSTLTFSLATTLAVGGFSESASAAKKGARYSRNNNAPIFRFEAIYETDDGKRIEDEFPKEENIGVFKDAITLICCSAPFFSSDLNNSGAKAGGIFLSNNGENLLIDRLYYLDDKNNKPINLSASLDKQTNKVTYTIFAGDVSNYKKPKDFLSFAPINVPDGDFINNLENIINSSIPGTYGENNNNSGAGVLGLAIEETYAKVVSSPIKITQIGSRKSTTIPEPTTTLASLFVLGVSGISLRKRKKNDLI